MFEKCFWKNRNILGVYSENSFNLSRNWSFFVAPLCVKNLQDCQI